MSLLKEQVKCLKIRGVFLMYFGFLMFSWSREREHWEQMG